MYSVMMITLREGIEAFLIVAIASTYLHKTSQSLLIGALRSGTAVAVVLSIALGVVLARVGAMTPIWEAWLALAAAVLVIGCTVHMLRMGKHMGKEIRQKLDAANTGTRKAAWWAVFAFAVLMIGREGIEAATMVASLSTQTDMEHLVLGGILGVILAGIMAFLWAKFGHRINLSRFFQVTAVFMVMFSVQLVIYAFHEYTEAGALPGIDNSYWHNATEPYGPEGQYGAWLSYGLVLIPGLFLLISGLRDSFKRTKEIAA